MIFPTRFSEDPFYLCEELAGEEGAAPFDAGEESGGFRLDKVEYGGAARGAGVCSMTTTSVMGSHLKVLPVDRSHNPRNRRAVYGNPFAPFDVAGLETTHGEPTRVGSWKRRIQPRRAYGAPRQSSTLPV